MPPGCGRVVMTHRAIGTPNAQPHLAQVGLAARAARPRPRRPAATLARNRRRSQVPSVPVETSDSRMRGLSWNGPARALPLQPLRRRRVRPRPPAPRRWARRPRSRRGPQLHPPAEPAGEDGVVGGDGAVGQHDLHPAVVPEPGRAEQQLRHPPGGEPEAGVRGRTAPSRGRRRCPSGPTAASASRSPCSDFTG